MPPEGFRVRYRTLEFDDVDIHVRTLRDLQEFFDAGSKAAASGIYDGTWSHFGVIWDSSIVLARLMLDFEIEGKRILEVGCGIALSSLVLNHRSADISATDHHLEAEGFLDLNVELNDGDKIPFFLTAWEDPERAELGTFDLIIGSDLLYEQGHAEKLSSFIDQHAAASCEVVLVDPGRGYHARFSKKMVALGFSHRQHKPKDMGDLKKPFPGQVLRYHRQGSGSEAGVAESPG